MKIRIWFLPLTLATGIFFSTSSQAQIIPDNTLGADRSVINRVDELRDRISGGTTRGSNLFHSFEEFNIGNGLEVYFANPEGIANIFSRVTGSNISEILGTLGVEGNANLFFINPNGIVFGENARLDLGGSFVATTADKVEFNNGGTFSARNTEEPLLRLNVPIGLGLNRNPGSIIVKGTGHELLLPPFSPTINPETEAGLQVSPGSTLALIGGDLILDGAILKAKSGQIELGSVSSEGNVALDINSSDSILSYEGISSFGDIQFSNKSLVDASSIDKNFDSGNIRVFGGNISLTGGSLVLIQQQGSSFGGDLSINATESLFIAGTDPLANVDNFRTNSGLRNENLGQNVNGKTQVSAKKLTIQDGAQIVNLSHSEGTGGNLNITASDTIEIVGISPLNPNYSSLISTGAFNSGDAGNLTLSAKNLRLMEGSSISSSNFGSGEGGDVNVNASNSIQIIGVEPLFLFPSNIGANAFNSGNAGNITINTSNLQIQDGGRIDSSTLASGDSGSITINVSDLIKIDGMVTGSPNPSSIISAANIVNENLRQVLRLPPIPSGNAGSVTINSSRLSITNGAIIGVQNRGTGDAGKLQINSNFINLNNTGNIAASTLSGNGGNITINSDRLQLDNSNISASAGGDGNGGNVTITTDTLLAFKDSNVTATAVFGNGGNIFIDADALLGIEERPATPGNGTSDADASSEFGQDGTVTITNPQSGIQDPVIAFREPEITILEPKFEADCVEQKKRLTDSRHDNIPRNPDTSFYNEPYLPNNNFVPPQEPPQFNPQSLEDLIWREGYPVASGDHLVTTPDGKLLLVVKSQFESLKRRGCISPEVRELE